MLHLLPTKYYENYALLLTGLYILLKDSITEAELQTADDLLKQFVEGYRKLYDKSTLPQAPVELETLQQQKTDLLLAVQRERLAKEVRDLEADLRALQLDVPSSQLSAIPPGAQPPAATHPGATTPVVTPPVATPPGATPPVAPPPVDPPPVAPPPVAPPPVVSPPIVPPPIVLRTSPHLEEAFSTDRPAGSTARRPQQPAERNTAWSTAPSSYTSRSDDASGYATGGYTAGSDAASRSTASRSTASRSTASRSTASRSTTSRSTASRVTANRATANHEVSVLDSGMQVDTSDDKLPALDSGMQVNTSDDIVDMALGFNEFVQDGTLETNTDMSYGAQDPFTGHFVRSIRLLRDMEPAQSPGHPVWTVEFNLAMNQAQLDTRILLVGLGMPLSGTVWGEWWDSAISGYLSHGQTRPILPAIGQLRQGLKLFGLLDVLKSDPLLGERLLSYSDLSLDQWITALLIYQFIYTQRHPSHCRPLIAYLSLIRTMASRRANCRRYDEMFPDKLSRSPAKREKLTRLCLLPFPHCTPSPGLFTCHTACQRVAHQISPLNMAATSSSNTEDARMASPNLLSDADAANQADVDNGKDLGVVSRPLSKKIQRRRAASLRGKKSAASLGLGRLSRLSSVLEYVPVGFREEVRGYSHPSRPSQRTNWKSPGGSNYRTDNLRQKLKAKGMSVEDIDSPVSACATTSQSITEEGTSNIRSVRKLTFPNAKKNEQELESTEKNVQERESIVVEEGYYVGQTSQVQKLVNNVNSNMKCRTEGCNGMLIPVQCTKVGLGGGMRVVYACSGCAMINFGINFDSSTIVESSRRHQVSLALCLAMLVTGNTYAGYDKVFGQETLNRKNFHTVIRDVYPITRKLIEEHCEAAKTQMRNMSEDVMGSAKRAVTQVDGTLGTRGFHSKNYTVTVRNAMNNSLLYVAHLCMKGSNTTSSEDFPLFKGTAKSA
ncbi:Hypp6604 [Branchiostoma lanceolatum]|uniref:Hypp6604 protein n=1 Tax=Branchiostoma lanceolatum TaxID=7740 RepID=A0A8J9YV40_BRALA|nr:Hypp6604 [Branchiostoma lanceolatum]